MRSERVPGDHPAEVAEPAGSRGRGRRPVFAVALLAGLLGPGDARAAGERPTEADLAACNEFAREQLGVPAYTESAPASPFPSRLSAVGPWTGPIAGTRAPRPVDRSIAPGAVQSPGASGVFGAGGDSQEGMSEAGHVDVRFKEAFDACMRARGF